MGLGECDRQLTHELDPGDGRLLTPSPVLEMCVPLASLAPRSCSKDTALRQWCRDETVWMVRETEPSEGLCINS